MPESFVTLILFIPVNSVAGGKGLGLNCSLGFIGPFLAGVPAHSSLHSSVSLASRLAAGKGISQGKCGQGAQHWWQVRQEKAEQGHWVERAPGKSAMERDNGE